MASFDGKTLLVTGGASGLGLAVAEAGAKAGARIALLDINDVDGQDAAARLGGAYWHLDVSDPTQWSNVVEGVESKFGPIHYAHLNAGVMTQGLGGDLEQAKLQNVSTERYRKVMGVNIDGAFFGFQTLIPRMNASNGEAITVTISAAGLIPIAFDPLYALTKHAVVGLVRSLALAHAKDRLRINAICPGGFASPMLPAHFRTATTMSAAQMAEEVFDLLLRGEMGEMRLKLREESPSTNVPPPMPSLG